MGNPSKPELTLLGVRFSHYVEKARWALDRFEIPYREIPMMPVTHFAYVARYTRGRGAPDKHSTRFSTPILIDERGARIQKSSVIMRYVSDRYGGKKGHLFPSDEAAQLDQYYNDFLGPSVRRVFYHHALKHPEILGQLADRNVSSGQSWCFKRLFPVVRSLLSRVFDVGPEALQKHTGYLYKEYEAVEKRLSDGRPFLLGDTFSAADISFACLGGVAMLPSPEEGFGAWFPPAGGPSEELRRISSDLRSSVAGKWALRLYREEHGRRVVPCEPSVLKGKTQSVALSA